MRALFEHKEEENSLIPTKQNDIIYNKLKAFNFNFKEITTIHVKG